MANLTLMQMAAPAQNKMSDLAQSWLNQFEPQWSVGVDVGLTCASGLQRTPFLYCDMATLFENEKSDLEQLSLNMQQVGPQQFALTQAAVSMLQRAPILY